MIIKAFEIQKGDKIAGRTVVKVQDIGGVIGVAFETGQNSYYDFNQDVEVERE